MFQVEEPIFYFKSSENMEEIENNSIQLIMTSPPYGKIKDYGIPDQIGFSDSFEEYFQRLKKVWKECFRVLETQCRLVVNVGDQYLRTTEFGRYRIVPIASKIIEDCLELGFDFLGDIIWRKVSTTNTTGGCSLMGSIYYPRNGLLTYDYEHILIFKKHEGKKRKVDLETKELSKIPLSEWKKWYVGHWRFPGIVQKEHIAMFPEELPYRIIRMFSYIGDTVLDPFMGSGTTLKVAKSLFRKSIGYEINEEFRSVIEEKIKGGKIGYFEDYQLLQYHIYKKAQHENIEIEYNKQKKKGILILKDKMGLEIIVDYVLLDNLKYDEEEVLRELNSKITENPISNFLSQKETWDTISKYIIVINPKFEISQEFKDSLKEFRTQKGISEKVKFVLFNQIISKDTNLNRLFVRKN